ncbi:MAG TPA: RNA methyltransferase, partial [Subdoligranulum sp.]|nr:RNA methyltransferase [Subdoligranulum sp.]
METITSRENAKIKYACAVRDSEKQRAADGLFFAEGPKLCLELAKSCTPRAMYATAAALAKTPELAQFDPAEIAPHVAEKLSGTKSNQGVFALFETPVPPADTLDTARRILMLEGVQDPGNV